MAVNESRSANADMTQGTRDGRYKSLTPGRGGVVETSNVEQRSKELQMQYGMLHGASCGCGAC
jgi:hypothetical protein